MGVPSVGPEGRPPRRVRRVPLRSTIETRPVFRTTVDSEINRFPSGVMITFMGELSPVVRTVAVCAYAMWVAAMVVSAIPTSKFRWSVICSSFLSYMRREGATIGACFRFGECWRLQRELQAQPDGADAGIGGVCSERVVV